jgi:UDP-galactopyranose mutase
VTINDLPSADAYVITAPLDQFMTAAPLPWRGVRTELMYDPVAITSLRAPVVNYPGADVPYTREIQTSLMAKTYGAASVIAREYPGASARHYPVNDLAGDNRRWHQELARTLQASNPSIVLAGRLATYSYIDMDQAIIQGINAARRVLTRA